VQHPNRPKTSQNVTYKQNLSIIKMKQEVQKHMCFEVFTAAKIHNAVFWK